MPSTATAPFTGMLIGTLMLVFGALVSIWNILSETYFTGIDIMLVGLGIMFGMLIIEVFGKSRSHP